MDTLTHALSGALVGRLFGQPAGRLSGVSALPGGDSGRPTVAQAMVTGFFAAAFPDVDALLLLVGEIAYLEHHRGITHSLLLAPLWAVLLAQLSTLPFRSLRGRRGSWRRLYPVTFAAIIIHIAGDLITQFGTMIFAPLSSARFGLGTTFIIDLGLTGLIVAGLAASAFLPRSRLPAAVALLAVIGWIGLGGWGRSEAITAGKRWAASDGIRALAIDAAPRPLSPFNWTVIVDDGAAFHVAHLNTRRREPLTASPDDDVLRRLRAPYRPPESAQWQVRPRWTGSASQQAFARTAWERPEFAFFRWFAMFPVHDASDERISLTLTERCAGFRDLRFEIPAREAVPFRYGLCQRVGAPGWTVYAPEGSGRRIVRGS